MGTITVSFVIKITILLVAFVTIYYSIYGYVNDAKENSYYLQMKEIGEYVQSKAEYGLENTKAYGKNITQKLNLPQLDFLYTVKITCNSEGLKIKTSAETATSRYFETIDFFNCSNIKATGKVYAGKKCLITEKVNETYMNIKLVNDCGLE